MNFVVFLKIDVYKRDVVLWVNDVYRRMSQLFRRLSEISYLFVEFNGDVSRRSSQESGWFFYGSRRFSRVSLFLLINIQY